MAPNLNTPEKRLAQLLRERRELGARLRQGAISADEYVATFRALVDNARLHEPNLSRPPWADDLAWLLRSILQAVYSGVLRDGEHVAILHQTASGLRHAASIDEGQRLAVYLPSALPVLASFGFSLPETDVHQALATGHLEHSEAIVSTKVRVSLAGHRHWAVLLDLEHAKKLAASPRRTPSGE